MPNVQVEVGVSVSNATTGKLQIKIKPWRVHVRAGDTLEWVPVALTTNNIVSWLRIDAVPSANPWPFPDVPPNAAYTGTKANHPKTPHGRKGGLAVGTIIPYAIAIAFTDPAGNVRTVTVDPDMVID